LYFIDMGRCPNPGIFKDVIFVYPKRRRAV
jgi:hypothetical protein